MAWAAPLSGASREERRQHAIAKSKWRPIVEAGAARCQQGIPGNGSSGTCIHRTRAIHRGQPWALGHRDDRAGYIGPVHADCNQRDASSRGGIARNAARNGTPRTRRRALGL